MHEQGHVQPHAALDSGHTDKNSQVDAAVGLMAALSFLALAVGLVIATVFEGFG
jgi:hypothetical protein